MAGKLLKVVLVILTWSIIALFYIAIDYADKVGTFSKCNDCLIKFNQTILPSFQHFKDNMMSLMVTFFASLSFALLMEPKKKEKSVYLVHVLDHEKDDDLSVDEPQEKPVKENDAAVMVQ